MPDSRRRLAIASAVFVTVLWSSSWLLIRWGLDDEGVGPITFAGLRYSVAAVVLGVWVAAQPELRTCAVGLDGSARRQLVVFGLVFITLTQGAQFVAIDNQPAATTSLTLAPTALFVGLIFSRALGERPGRHQIVGASLIVIGSLVYFGGPLGATAIGMTAAGLGLGANVTGALLGRSINRTASIPPVLVTAASMGVGSVALLAIGALVEPQPRFTVGLIALVLWLGVVNTAVAFTVWNRTLQRLTALESAAINNTMLVQIAAIAWFALDEVPGGLGVVGIAIVSVGAFLAASPARATVPSGGTAGRSDMKRARRVAIVGMFLESNVFSRPVTEAGFRAFAYLEGDEVSDDARSDHPRVMGEVSGFYAHMDGAGDWEPVPVLVAMSGGGAVDHGFFTETLQKVRARLCDVGPLDAVYLCNHGAMATTAEEDGDGTFASAVRDAVGSDVPIIATLDPHGNVSDQFVDAVDVVVAYLTDPHVDQFERGEEAAALLHEVWSGMDPAMVAVRLPIVAPNVSLFTDEGPFAELIALGQAGVGGAIANVSILGGFAFSDTSHNGLMVIVTARNDDAAARALARELADAAWERRRRFRADVTSLDEAVGRAVAVGADLTLPAIVLSDLGDNTGAGGPTNSLWMLEALHGAGAEGVLLVNFRDRRLVDAAHDAGVGSVIDATFRGDDWGRAEDTTYAAGATVVALHRGPMIGRRGIVAGKTLDCGPTALLDLGGVHVVVTSRAAVGNDPVYAEALGVDLARVRTIVVKVRSSFPVAYDEYVSAENTYFVDTPGRTSPVLHRLPFQRLPRPVYPLDEGFEWRNPLTAST